MSRATLALALGWLVSAAACSAALSPPCDAETLKTLLAQCTVEALACGRSGGTEAECNGPCNAKLDAREQECSK